MPAADSRDLRERLLRAHDAGLSHAEIERTTGVVSAPLLVGVPDVPRASPWRPAPVPVLGAT